MHVSSRGVLGRPDADRVFGNGIEVPELLSGLRIVGPYETADAVFTAIRSNQNLVLDDGWSHGLAIPELRIRNVGFPDDIAGLCIQRHQLGIQRAEIDEIAEHLDAAIVGTAAVRRHRSHLVIVVPELYA